jgi:hypothetical protein
VLVIAIIMRDRKPEGIHRNGREGRNGITSGEAKPTKGDAEKQTEARS